MQTTKITLRCKQQQSQDKFECEKITFSAGLNLMTLLTHSSTLPPSPILQYWLCLRYIYSPRPASYPIHILKVNFEQNYFQGSKYPILSKIFKTFKLAVNNGFKGFLSNIQICKAHCPQYRSLPKIQVCSTIRSFSNSYKSHLCTRLIHGMFVCLFLVCFCFASLFV